MTIEEIIPMSGEMDNYDEYLLSEYVEPFLNDLTSVKTRRWWHFRRPDFRNNKHASPSMDFICRNSQHPKALKLVEELRRVLGFNPCIVTFPFRY
jgi:hypothetical protein